MKKIKKGDKVVRRVENCIWCLSEQPKGTVGYVERVDRDGDPYVRFGKQIELLCPKCVRAE